MACKMHTSWNCAIMSCQCGMLDEGHEEVVASNSDDPCSQVLVSLIWLSNLIVPSMSIHVAMVGV